MYFRIIQELEIFLEKVCLGTLIFMDEVREASCLPLSWPELSTVVNSQLTCDINFIKKQMPFGSTVLVNLSSLQGHVCVLVSVASGKQFCLHQGCQPRWCWTALCLKWNKEKLKDSGLSISRLLYTEGAKNLVNKIDLKEWNEQIDCWTLAYSMFMSRATSPYNWA